MGASWNAEGRPARFGGQVGSHRYVFACPILAVGAHTAETRELSEDVLASAQVVVEDLGAARREAGDVAVGVEKRALNWDDVAVMADVVRGDVVLDPQRRVVFKTVGMPWEDLAVARALVGRLS